MARENLDVTVIVLANRSYQILHGELRSMGAGAPGKRAKDMLTLDRPDLDWTALAAGLGVEAARSATLDDLGRQLQRAFSRRGPCLIELAL
jgi:acetolactate synthase-1/2/3 large subunit